MQPVQRKPKKRVVEVPPKISPRKEIINPITGTLDWGQFPLINTVGKTFPAGPIRLRHGEHYGPERGFGLAHIWAARKYSDTFGTPEEAIADIADFLLSILQPGAEIYYEGNLATKSDRAMVFKTKSGTVILEERVDGMGCTFYSIVTAIPRPSARGTLIGNMA